MMNSFAKKIHNTLRDFSDNNKYFNSLYVFTDVFSFLFRVLL